MTLVNKAGPLRINGSNSITLINIGAAIIMIDMLTLNPGDSFSVEGWPDEENHSNYQVSYPGATSDLLVIEKLYIS